MPVIKDSMDIGSVTFYSETYINDDDDVGHKEVGIKYTEHSTDHWNSHTTTEVEISKKAAQDIIDFLKREFNI